MSKQTGRAQAKPSHLTIKKKLGPGSCSYSLRKTDWPRGVVPTGYLGHCEYIILRCSEPFLLPPQPAENHIPHCQKYVVEFGYPERSQTWIFRIVNNMSYSLVTPRGHMHGVFLAHVGSRVRLTAEFTASLGLVQAQKATIVDSLFHDADGDSTHLAVTRARTSFPQFSGRPI
jgi:hypothetical protein